MNTDSGPVCLIKASGIYIVINGFTGPIAMLLNGLGHLRPQVVAAVLMAVLNLALSIVLVQRVGVAGPVLGTDIAQTVCIIVPMGIYAIRLVRNRPAPAPAVVVPAS